jgi:hypothetical protein
MLEGSLKEVLERFSRVDRFLDSLDLVGVADRGRFAEYRRRIERTLQQFDDVEDAASRRQAEKSFLEEGLTGYGVALTESEEWAEVVPYLEGCDPEIVRQKVKDILSGPRLPLDESATSNHARNTLFELNMAARLWRAGLKPELGKGTDVRCQIRDRQILIECKRPFREEGIGPNLKKAGGQLREGLENAPTGARGVIAMSLTRLVSKGDKYIVASSEEVARRGMRDHMLMIEAGSNSVWANLGEQIVGILFHVVALVQLEDRGIFATGQLTNAHPLARPNSFDYRMFKDLCEHLGAATY